ncbi:hypothetical protein ACFL16_01820, partial [Patescibacteria group bacterium]
MNIGLQNFVEKFFSDGDYQKRRALNLSAGNFVDIEYLNQRGWKCWSVDVGGGMDLKGVYITKNSFDLVFSSYTLHQLKDKDS